MDTANKESKMNKTKEKFSNFGKALADQGKKAQVKLQESGVPQKAGEFGKEAVKIAGTEFLKVMKNKHEKEKGRN